MAKYIAKTVYRIVGKEKKYAARLSVQFVVLNASVDVALYALKSYFVVKRSRVRKIMVCQLRPSHALTN